MTLHIKYMVSLRCKMVVKEVFNQLKLHYETVNLGEVDLREDISEQERANIKRLLLASGLELLDDRRAILIERIRM